MTPQLCLTCYSWRGDGLDTFTSHTTSQNLNSPVPPLSLPPTLPCSPRQSHQLAELHIWSLGAGAGAVTVIKSILASVSQAARTVSRTHTNINIFQLNKNGYTAAICETLNNALADFFKKKNI